MKVNHTIWFLVLIWTLITESESAEIKRISPRIVGGSHAYLGQFPFASAISVQSPSGRIFCGGTLIAAQWVVTAGQCVNGATSLTIQFGSNRLTATDANRVTVTTSVYSLHPGFNGASLENDIALIKLQNPIPLTSYVNTATLPSVPVQVTTSVVALGWGQINETTDLEEELNWVELKSISNDVCRTTYGSQITDNMVCVSGKSNEGTCIGDSGGPLITVPSRGVNVIMGVSSFYSGNGCQSTEPSGYTRIFPYLDWIKNTTQA